jgi:hypothetical protein
MLPSESESHTLLAEIRQQQNRWPEAITQWEQVARIRALEPTGLLKLAEAQIHERRWEAAVRTLRTLDTRSWPARFGDVHAQIRILEEQIEACSKPVERGKGARESLNDAESGTLPKPGVATPGLCIRPSPLGEGW